MKDSGSLHLKVQEQIDCQAGTDPLAEMSRIKDGVDKDEAALKWLALSVLHGINANAKKITVARDGDGNVRVTAKYRPSTLPSPGGPVGEKIFQAIRDITHIAADKGKIPLAVGVRDASVELEVSLKREDGADKLSIVFPE